MWKKMLMQPGARSKAMTAKPKRKLKKDVIAEITEMLGYSVEGLDKCTIATLEALLEAIKVKVTDTYNGAAIDFAARVVTGE